MKVFISSTYVDLSEHRRKAGEAIERLGQQGIRMEVFGARPDDATTVCNEEIESAELFLGIYAHRYGYVAPGSAKSITEMEYDFAAGLGTPTFCFVVEDDHPWRPAFVEGDPGRTKLAAFKARIGSAVVLDRFTTPDDLAYKISASLGRYLITRRVKETLDRASKLLEVGTDTARSQVARRAARLASLLNGARLLLVNDVPAEMEHVIAIFRSLDVAVTVAHTSQEALDYLGDHDVDVVISDMQRDGVQDEGSRFLRQKHDSGFEQPTIITLADFDLSRGTPAYAFGITNRVDELLNLTFDAIERMRG
jgi:CheY-like chemotaxis protein